MTIMGFSLIEIFSVKNIVGWVYLFSLLIVILSSITLLVHINRIFWREVPKGFWRAVFQTPIVRIIIRTRAFWIMIGAMVINKIAEYFFRFSVAGQANCEVGATKDE
ncbi:MAG: hypothetical protein ING12_15980 [Roseomonas sp.]|nr:hypothetical protein [Roseomonas sp.]